MKRYVAAAAMVLALAASGTTGLWADGEVTTFVTMSNPRVEGCVQRQVKSWKFPTSDSATNVAAYPFKFGIGG